MTTETIEAPYHEFHGRMQDIVAANGLVTRMEVKPSSYVLTVQYPPENKTGDAADRNATPPVQHDSDLDDGKQMAQTEM